MKTDRELLEMAEPDPAKPTLEVLMDLADVYANVYSFAEGDTMSLRRELLRKNIEAALAELDTVPTAKTGEVVAMRGGFDGYGYQYIDNGSGSDWRERHPDWEPVYDGPSFLCEPALGKPDPAQAPQRREPLTDEQIKAIQKTIWHQKWCDESEMRFARAIEAAHGIGEKP